MPIERRIFIGMIQDGELKMHLKQSKRWKEDSLLNASLVATESKGKEYVGLYLDSPVSCSELKEREKALRSQLHQYCPKLKVEQRRVYLFTQVFIG